MNMKNKLYKVCGVSHFNCPISTQIKGSIYVYSYHCDLNFIIALQSRHIESKQFLSLNLTKVDIRSEYF